MTSINKSLKNIKQQIMALKDPPQNTRFGFGKKNQPVYTWDTLLDSVNNLISQTESLGEEKKGLIVQKKGSCILEARRHRLQNLKKRKRKVDNNCISDGKYVLLETSNLQSYLATIKNLTTTTTLQKRLLRYRISETDVLDPIELHKYKECITRSDENPLLTWLVCTDPIDSMIQGKSHDVLTDTIIWCQEIYKYLYRNFNHNNELLEDKPCFIMNSEGQQLLSNIKTLGTRMKYTPPEITDCIKCLYTNIDSQEKCIAYWKFLK